MADAEQEAPEPKAKKSRVPLLLGLVLAAVLGGGSFFVMYSGLLNLGAGHGEHAESGNVSDENLPNDIAFVPLDPLLISLGKPPANRHLRFAAQLEVAAAYEADVTHLVPRVLDVLNSYLRAVNLSDLEDSASLIVLRAQMLRRIQIVTGEGRVRDLLITEFVFN